MLSQTKNPEDNRLLKIVYSFNLTNLDKVIGIIRGIDPYALQASRMNLAYAKTRNMMREIRGVL